MRADRLLALMLLLQTRGRMTAGKLAEILEVSERTIYRDIEALSAAGIPVYTEGGPGGGCMLVDKFQTNLTGLTEEELNSLFMLNIPDPLNQLGVGQTLRSAMLKLAASLPATRRFVEEHSRQRLYLDSSEWFNQEESLPHLPTLYQAVWQSRRLALTYLVRFETRVEVPVECVVEPYGLVAKASIWYLIAAREGQLRTYRVSQVQEARLLGEQFERPSSFELESFWKDWCARYEEQRNYYPVTVRVAPAFLPEISRNYGPDLKKEGPDGDGWVILTLPFSSLEAARERLLGYGRAIEVLKPEALRKSIADFAIQIATLYRSEVSAG